MQQCWRYKRGWPVDSFLIHLLEFNRKSWLKSGRSTPFTTFTIVPLEHSLQNIWITDSFQVGRPSCVTIFIDRERYKIIGTDNMKVAAGESICMWRPCSNTHVFDTRFTISRLLLVKSISYQIQPFPSRSFKGSHKKISLIFKDAAISCSFSSCFVACFFATQLSNSALSPDHQHFLGVQHYWNTTQTICIFWLSNIEQTYWDKFWFEPSCHLHKSWRLVIEFPNGVA